jgi:hypothetical protein
MYRYLIIALLLVSSAHAKPYRGDSKNMVHLGDWCKLAAMRVSVKPNDKSLDKLIADLAAELRLLDFRDAESAVYVDTSGSLVVHVQMDYPERQLVSRSERVISADQKEVIETTATGWVVYVKAKNRAVVERQVGYTGRYQSVRFVDY